MNRLVIILLCFAIVSSSLTSCNKDMVVVNYEDPNLGNEPEEPKEPEEATISTTSETFRISAVAGKLKSVVLITNQTNITVSPVSSDWYSTEVVGKEIRIRTLTKNSTDQRKSQLVTVTAGTAGNIAETTFTIEQNTMLDEPAEITVGQSVYNIGGKSGETIRITMISNQDVFVASADAAWYKSSFDGTTLVITTTSANTTGEILSHDITVTAGTAPNTAQVTFNIKQALKPELDKLIGTVKDGAIIFQVNRVEGKYKAVSLIDHNPTGNTIFWQKANTERVLVGAGDAEDGRVNVPLYKATPDFSIYIAVKACDDMAPTGTWYLPAKNEVTALYSAVEDYGRDVFNTTITSNGGLAFDYAGKTYWTSTEKSITNVHCLRFSDNKWLDQSKLSGARFIRCIIEGDITE